jgi:hypothetical protein
MLRVYWYSVTKIWIFFFFSPFFSVLLSKIQRVEGISLKRLKFVMIFKHFILGNLVVSLIYYA